MAIPCAIGVDVGGTKCAAGLVQLSDGRVLASRRIPTDAARGGQAILTDVIEIVKSLAAEAVQIGALSSAVGIGVAELVGRDGRVLSDATIGWTGCAVDESIQQAAGLPVRIEADVRAAARAEARLGAGRGRHSFLFVTVGTGVSSSLVIGGVPYAGARGLTGTCASSRGLIPVDDGQLAAGPPLEQFASGPAIASRYSALRGDRSYTTHEVIELCEASEHAARAVVSSAAEALGAAIGHMVNVLDPAIVVLGGGLGMVEGMFRRSIEQSMRAHIWSDLHRDLPLLSAQFGIDAGVIGAALAAVESES